MNAARYREVKSVFMEACVREPRERESYLSGACGVDAELRRAVEALLASDEASSAGVVQHVREQVMAVTRQGLGGGLEFPERIGRYRLLRKLGEGGMGVVYEAQQESPRRVVALKLLAGGLAGADELRRFEHETELLGRLQHPGIAQIHEAGTFDSVFGQQPYFVMERVDGLPLLEHAAARDLDVPARLRLFARLCDALEHAHRKGVIHRDLKPANILVVDGSASEGVPGGPPADGQPKILDFGIGRAIDIEGSGGARRTRSQQLLGTLAYMSPEQALGGAIDADTRSDVYALGVILYELLTGVLPYPVSGPVLEVVEHICTTEPRRPSERNGAIEADVETIMLHCLSKEPDRRYQSAAELARDIRHALAGELIEVRRDSRLYVLRKTVARHRTASAVALGVLILLTVGLAFAVGMWRMTAGALDEAQQARGELINEARKAESVNGFLRRMLGSADPEVGGDPEITMREGLDEAVNLLGGGQLVDQPAIRAAVLTTAGEAYLALGEVESAQRLLQEALDLRWDVTGDSDRRGLAQNLAAMARVQRAQGRLEDARALFEKALTLLSPDRAADQETIASILEGLGFVLQDLGLMEDAVAAARKALAIRLQFEPDADPDVAHAKASLALILHDPAESGALLRESLATERQLRGRRHPRAARILSLLAGIQHLAGDYEGAEASYRESIDIAEDAYGRSHRRVIMNVCNLSWLYSSRGDMERAGKLLEEYEPAARAAYGEASVPYAGYLQDIGDIRTRLRDGAGAELLLRRALGILEHLEADHSPNGAAMRISLAASLFDHGDGTQIEEVLDALLAIDERALPATHWTRAQARTMLGEVCTARGDFERAFPLLTAGYEQLEATHVPRSMRALAAQRLAEMYEAWNAASPRADLAEAAAQWRARQDALSVAR